MILTNNRDSRGSLLTEEDYVKKDFHWQDTTYRHIIAAPHEKMDENNPYKGHDIQCIWIMEICVSIEYQRRGAARAAYEVLFNNPNLSLPYWPNTEEGKKGIKSPPASEYRCDPIKAKEFVFFAYVVRKPFDNQRSLKFHERNGFKTKVLTFNSDNYADLEKFESEMYAKHVKQTAINSPRAHPRPCGRGRVYKSLC